VFVNQASHLYACARSAGAERRQQAIDRVRVGEVHADRGGLVEHERLAVGAGARRIDEHRDQPVRIQRQVVGRLVRRDGAVDVLQRERHAELLEHDVRDQAGVAGKVVELEHGCGSEDGDSAPASIVRRSGRSPAAGAAPLRASFARSRRRRRRPLPPRGDFLQ
jgi:hypothetical protein